MVGLPDCRQCDPVYPGRAYGSDGVHSLSIDCGVHLVCARSGGRYLRMLVGAGVYTYRVSSVVSPTLYSYTSAVRGVGHWSTACNRLLPVVACIVACATPPRALWLGLGTCRARPRVYWGVGLSACRQCDWELTHPVTAVEARLSMDLSACRQCDRELTPQMMVAAARQSMDYSAPRPFRGCMSVNKMKD